LSSPAPGPVVRNSRLNVLRHAGWERGDTTGRNPSASSNVPETLQLISCHLATVSFTQALRTVVCCTARSARTRAHGNAIGHDLFGGDVSRSRPTLPLPHPQWTLSLTTPPPTHRMVCGRIRAGRALVASSWFVPIVGCAGEKAVCTTQRDDAPPPCARLRRLPLGCDGREPPQPSPRGKTSAGRNPRAATGRNGAREKSRTGLSTTCLGRKFNFTATGASRSPPPRETQPDHEPGEMPGAPGGDVAARLLRRAGGTSTLRTWI